jgi:hypothetical protein
MLWLCLVVAVILGAIFGGWRSLRLARQGELEQAHRMLRSAALVAGISGGLLPWPILGWPWLSISVPVPEEVIETVTETIDVPVTIWKWFIWPVSGVEHHETTKDVPKVTTHNETRKQFSFILLLLMVCFGTLCFYAEKWLFSFIWRCRG